MKFVKGLLTLMIIATIVLIWIAVVMAVKAKVGGLI